jgi:integrase
MAIVWGRASGNPVQKVRFAREQNGRIRILSAEEEQRLLSHCGPQLQPLVIAALHNGFRASELLSLTWEDVEFKRRVITVRAAYAKNGESRSVPMNAVLIETFHMIRMNTSAVTGPGVL